MGLELQLFGSDDLLEDLCNSGPLWNAFKVDRNNSIVQYSAEVHLLSSIITTDKDVIARQQNAAKDRVTLRLSGRWDAHMEVVKPLIIRMQQLGLPFLVHQVNQDSQGITVSGGDAVKTLLDSSWWQGVVTRPTFGDKRCFGHLLASPLRPILGVALQEANKRARLERAQSTAVRQQPGPAQQQQQHLPAMQDDNDLPEAVRTLEFDVDVEHDDMSLLKRYTHITSRSDNAFNITALEQDCWAMPDVNMDAKEARHFVREAPVKV